MSSGPFQRARVRARQRALAELARRHADEFDELHAVERVAEGLTASSGDFTPRPPAECGTRSGYRRHRRHGEEPCVACRAAERDYQRARQRAS